MRLTILAAAGATGRELTRQALERGHTVIAVARDPQRIDAADSSQLLRLSADVRDPAAIARAFGAGATVLSALGQTDPGDVGVLTSGVRAVLASKPNRVIWLGAYGTGATAAAAGWATRALLSLMGERIVDKVVADSTVLESGGTVFHAGPLSNKPLSTTRRCVGLNDAPRRFFPARVSRATVAALMLDEAEAERFAGATVIPLER